MYPFCQVHYRQLPKELQDALRGNGERTKVGKHTVKLATKAAEQFFDHKRETG
jgi:hypothetical protein